GGDTGSIIKPSNFQACGTPCTLRMMGTVGPATAANNYAGIAYLGFAIGQGVGTSTPSKIAPTGSSLTITFTASTGGLPLRAQLSDGSTSWCYVIPTGSPVTIPYTSFNTMCFGTGGTAYAKQPLQNIQLVVPGGATATQGVSVTLVSVREN